MPRVQAGSGGVPRGLGQPRLLQVPVRARPVGVGRSWVALRSGAAPARPIWRGPSRPEGRERRGALWNRRIFPVGTGSGRVVRGHSTHVATADGLTCVRTKCSRQLKTSRPSWAVCLLAILESFCSLLTCLSSQGRQLWWIPS